MDDRDGVGLGLRWGFRVRICIGFRIWVELGVEDRNGFRLARSKAKGPCVMIGAFVALFEASSDERLPPEPRFSGGLDYWCD